MNLRNNLIGTGFRTALFFIGTGMLTVLISVLDVSRTGAAPAAVVTELPSQERDLLDQQANAAKAKSQMQKRTITNITHVKLDVDTILRERSISLNFLGVSLDVRRDEVHKTKDGITTWVGHVGADKINRAIFTIKDGKVVGTVHNGILVYQIRPVERSTRGVHTIYEIDQTRFPSEGSHWSPPGRRSFSRNLSSGKIDSYAPAANFLHSSTFPITTVSLPGSTQIDLLVAYGDDVKTAAGTNIDTEIIQAVDDANYTFIDSQIALVLCLVNITHVQGYRGSGIVETDFNCLAFNICDSKANADAADLIRSRRNSMHVDLVSAWVEEGNKCGWAYPNDGSPMESDLAYSVVTRTCATSDYSLAHELGHSMGTRHDRASVGVQNTNNGQQNYGHFSQAANQRTIMALQDFCPECVRIGFWSNLLNSLAYDDGTSPMGSASPSNAANNAGVLTANKNTVAGWQNPTSPSCKNPTAVSTDSTPPASPRSLRVQ
jgi:peptidyl-Asp metalloendopeptidase